MSEVLCNDVVLLETDDLGPISDKTVHYLLRQAGLLCQGIINRCLTDKIEAAKLTLKFCRTSDGPTLSIEAKAKREPDTRLALMERMAMHLNYAEELQTRLDALNDEEVVE